MNKVLLIGVGLHEEDGTGITLVNLFRGVPKDCICIITDRVKAGQTYKYGYKNVFVLDKVCDAIDRIPSLITHQQGQLEPSNVSVHNSLMSLRSIKEILKRLLINSGLYYRRSKYSLNDSMEQWLRLQAPSSIYSVSFHITLTLQIKALLHIPIVMHIMDDWISTEIKPGLLSFYWRNRINKELKELVMQSAEHIAISGKMAQEYHVRYGGEWKVFHNPLIVSDWLEYQKANYRIVSQFRIAFFGRITNTNKEIIHRLELVTSQLAKELQVEFHIYSQLDSNDSDHVFYHDFLPHDQLPQVMPVYDLLILPFFFDAYWTKYARLSMPTKFSEYLISGVPVLLISPLDTAIYEFCVEHDCAFYTSSLEVESIGTILKSIIDDQANRERVAEIGKELASRRFDSNVVSKNFLALFQGIPVVSD